MLSVAKPVTPIAIIETLPCIDRIVATTARAHAAGLEPLGAQPPFIGSHRSIIVIVLEELSLRGLANLDQVFGVNRIFRVSSIVLLGIEPGKRIVAVSDKHHNVVSNNLDSILVTAGRFFKASC